MPANHTPQSRKASTRSRAQKKATRQQLSEDERDARVIFDLLHNESISVRTRNSLFDDVLEILDTVGMTSTWEVFRVAWPLALRKLAGQKGA